MQGYIDEIKNIIETMPHNDYVQKLCQVIEPFYEYSNDDDTRPEPEQHNQFESLIQNNNVDDEMSSDEELIASNINLKMNGSNGHHHNHKLNGHSNLNGFPENSNKVLSSSSATSLAFNSNFSNGNGLNGDLNHETNSIEAIQSGKKSFFLLF